MSALDDRNTMDGQAGSPKPNRFGCGLSKHTTQRLKDLRARRAEMEDEVNSQTSSTSSQSSFKFKSSDSFSNTSIKQKNDVTKRMSSSPPSLPSPLTIPKSRPNAHTFITPTRISNKPTSPTTPTYSYLNNSSSAFTNGSTASNNGTTPSLSTSSNGNQYTSPYATKPAIPTSPYATKPAIPTSPYATKPAIPTSPYATKPAIPTSLYATKPTIPTSPYATKPTIPTSLYANKPTSPTSPYAIKPTSPTSTYANKPTSPTSPYATKPISPTSPCQPGYNTSAPLPNQSSFAVKRKDFTSTYPVDTKSNGAAPGDRQSNDSNNHSFTYPVASKFNESQSYNDQPGQDKSYLLNDKPVVSPKPKVSKLKENNICSDETDNIKLNSATQILRNFETRNADQCKNTTYCAKKVIINNQRNHYVSNDKVGENAATFTCASAVAMSKGMTGGSVGFSSLPDQVHRKAVRRGFDFTLMVVGDSGLGKSTLITSMFQNEELYENKEIDDTSSKISKTVEIDIKKLEIEEDGIRLRLTIVDTPGFNDAINSTESWKSIENYIDAQFDHFFQDESGISRKNIVDNRVHCCLYFISPYGHGLRPIDVKFMRQLHNKVNIVPVIAKADILTKPELERIKLRVLKEINEHQLNIYSFPEEDETDDDQQLRSSIPFAVIGADTIIEVAGKRIRGRRYPWGIVDVDNPDHCDFAKLRQMLISTHLQDLKDATRDLYENYRAKYIQEHVMTQSINGASGGGVSGGGKPLKYSESIIAAKDTEIQRMQEQIELMKAKLKQGEAIAV